MRIATILVGVVAITVVPGLALFTVGERAAGAVFLLFALRFSPPRRSSPASAGAPRRSVPGRVPWPRGSVPER